MLITKVEGIHFSEHGNTKDDLPKEWVEVKFNLRLKKHREAQTSRRTRIVEKLEGWKNGWKYPKPIISYWTDTPETVEFIMSNGDHTNAETFILNIKE